MAHQTGQRTEEDLIYQGPLIGMKETKQKSSADLPAAKKPSSSETDYGSLHRGSRK